MSPATRPRGLVGLRAAYVGNTSAGTLTVDSGSTIASKNGYVGNYNGSGTATVTGAHSTWNNTGSLYVGNLSWGLHPPTLSGYGTLLISSGGSVSDQDGYVGIDYYSRFLTGPVAGVVTVTGSGSTWNNTSSLNVGCQGEERSSSPAAVALAMGPAISARGRRAPSTVERPRLDVE